MFPLGSDRTHDQCENCNATATVLFLGSSADTDSVEVYLVPEGRYRPCEVEVHFTYPSVQQLLRKDMIHSVLPYFERHILYLLVLVRALVC